jgi:hypothetical protein
MTAVRRNQGTLEVYPAGRERPNPIIQREDYYDINLATPIPYDNEVLATKEFMENGGTVAEVRSLHEKALAAHERQVTRTVLTSMIVPGGFWNGDAMPEPHQSNVFTSAHQHYQYYATDQDANGLGIPEVGMFALADWHVKHHSDGGRLVCLMNSANIMAGITDLVDFDQSKNTILAQQMEDLQKYGFRPGFEVAGVPISQNDWVPPNYALFMVVNPADPICHWRLPAASETEFKSRVRGLIQEDVVPDKTIYFGAYIKQYHSCTLTYRSGGFACYFGANTNNGSYVTPDLYNLSALEI